MKLSPKTWPDVEACDLNHAAQLEVVKNLPPITLSLFTTSSTFVVQSIKGLIDCKKFGGLNQLLCVTSYVFWFIKNCRKQGNSCESTISCTEMNQSELLWIKAVQHSIFTCEIQSLHSRSISCPPLVKQFSLFLNNQNVLRCKDRLNNSSLCLLDPALLPHNDYFVQLLILWAHLNV